MEREFEKGDIDLAPNSVSYSIIIDAWARSRRGDAPVQAEKILRKMRSLEQAGNWDIIVDTVVFSSCIAAWAKSNDPEAAERATTILEEMEDLYAGGNYHVRPNTVTYSTVISAWSNSPLRDIKLTRAEAILRRMVDRSEAGDRNVAPNTITYNTVLKVIEDGAEADKARRAQAVLQQMHSLAGQGDLSVRPNVRTYNAVIRACSNTSGDVSAIEEAYGIAFDTLDELRSLPDLSPDRYTYPAMFRCCERLLPWREYVGDRSDAVRAIELVFRMCCEDGMLNKYILKDVSKFLPEKAFARLLNRSDAGTLSSVNLGSLPRSWSRHNIPP